MKKVRCSYVKDNGERCKREKNVEDDFKGEWRCWQHPLEIENVDKSTHHKKEEEFVVPREFENIDSIKKRQFLAAFTETGTIVKAAEASNVGRTSHYRWLDPEDDEMFDPDYVQAFKKAQKIATNRLEAEARRRAVKGVREPFFYKGEIVGHKIRYSDNLLMFLLKGNAPEKYKDRVEQNVNAELNHSINPIEAILQAENELEGEVNG